MRWSSTRAVCCLRGNCNCNSGLRWPDGEGLGESLKGRGRGQNPC